ncbi:hypothetical protein DH2020_022834 [Rehmannia glutinosa]|uniref:Uncharacterized protein n=1 Tax=Rehmannia glutinosa TaxID=99300 RepID=A0ABR0W787_REHGL
MKFLACLGAATVSPGVETAVGGRKTTAEQGRYCHTHGHTTSKRLPKVKSTHNWKPKLNAISEDSPLSEVNRGGVNRRIGGSGDKKRQVKVKPKSPARAAPPPIHEEDYCAAIRAIRVEVEQLRTMLRLLRSI